SLRIKNPFRQFRFVTKGHPAGFQVPLATNGPIRGTRRLLDDIRFVDAIPGHRPTDGPTVARTHLAAVHKIDSALRHTATIDQQPRGPARVRLNVTVPMKRAVQQNDWAGGPRAGDEVKNVAARRRTTIEKQLRAARRKIRGLGRALGRHAMFDTDLL